MSDLHVQRKEGGNAYVVERGDMLVDNLMFHGYESVGPLKPGLKAMLKDSLRKSRKFKLDAKACEACGWLVDDHPELIVQYSEFARAPFPTTWIEVPATTTLEKGAEVRHGWLIKGNDIYSFLEVANNGVPSTTMLTPVVATLHRPMPLAEQYKFADLGQTSRLGIDQVMWGRVLYEKIPTKLRKSLREQHSLGLTMPWKSALHEKNKELSQKMLTNLVHGEMVDVLGFLMLLMRPNHAKVIREAGKERRRSTGGKWKTFFAHNVVTVDLESKPLVKRIKAAVRRENNLRRRHEVRGHYCHNEAAKRTSSHTHEWAQVSDTMWECAYPHCGAKRWWKKAHERGSAEVGYVTKHYEVTDSRR